MSKYDRIGHVLYRRCAIISVVVNIKYRETYLLLFQFKGKQEKLRNMNGNRNFKHVRSSKFCCTVIYFHGNSKGNEEVCPEGFLPKSKYCKFFHMQGL